MPNETDFIPDDVSQAGTYAMQNRDQGNQQASVTYKVSSVGTKPLGKGGERFGIAKRNVMDDYETLEQDDRNLRNAQNLDQRERERQGNDLFTRKMKLEETTKIAFTGLYLENLVEVTSQHLQQGNLLSRAVASSRVDELLGTQALSQEKFGLTENGKVVGVSVGVDGVSMTGTLSTGEPYQLDVDYSDPEIQKGLSNLEAVDYITGQIDRHLGNIFIDPVTKQVRGIDNDLAFPGVDRSQIVASKDETVSGKLVANMPRYLHEDTARKIEKMTEQQLRDSLSSVKHPGSENGKLTAGEIDGAVNRLKELQKEIKVMRKEGRVVKEFTRETYQKSIETQEKVATDNMNLKLEEQSKKVMYKDGNIPENAKRDARVQGLEQCKKTSYLGALQVQKMKAEHSQNPVVKLKPDDFGTHGISSTIDRGPQMKEFQRLAEPLKRGFESQFREENMQQFMRHEKKIADYQSRLDDLQKRGPNLAKFKALRYGGVDRAISKFNEKLGNESAKLVDLNTEMGRDVVSKMQGKNQELWNQAVQNAPYDNRNEVNNGLGVQNRQVQQVQNVPQLQNPQIPVNREQAFQQLQQEMDNRRGVDLHALRDVSDKDLGREKVGQKQEKEGLQEVEGHEKEIELEDFTELEDLSELGNELEELSELDNQLEELVDNDLEELSVEKQSTERHTSVKEEMRKSSDKNLRNSQKLQGKDDDHSVGSAIHYDRNKKDPTLSTSGTLRHSKN